MVIKYLNWGNGPYINGPLMKCKYNVHTCMYVYLYYLTLGLCYILFRSFCLTKKIYGGLKYADKGFMIYSVCYMCMIIVLLSDYVHTCTYVEVKEWHDW